MVAQAGLWYEIPEKATAEEFQNPSRDLTDLVKMCNEAARGERGDILWLSYQCTDANHRDSWKKNLSTATWPGQ